MQTLILLVLITICYAAYNLLVKISSGQGGSLDTSPILATISLQTTALTLSLTYLAYLVRHDMAISLPGKTFAWAIGAGLCIGLAEIMYFYLFRGIAGEKPVAASVAIPFIVGGTIVIAVAVSALLFKESMNPGQWLGVGLAFVGMLILGLNSINPE